MGVECGVIGPRWRWGGGRPQWWGAVAGSGGRQQWWGERAGLEVTPGRLFALNGFEQRLEIAFSKAFGALSLDDLEEDGGPVLDRFCKYLEEIALFIPIDEDP